MPILETLFSTTLNLGFNQVKHVSFNRHLWALPRAQLTQVSLFTKEFKMEHYFYRLGLKWDMKWKMFSQFVLNNVVYQNVKKQTFYYHNIFKIYFRTFQ